MKDSQINYVYFGLLFLILTTLTASSIFHKVDFGSSQFFFFLYALDQITLEIVLLISIGSFIEEYFGRLSFSIFIGFTFVALFLHFFDYLMERILDLSVWSALKIFVFDESWENFLYLLNASGIKTWIWVVFFLFLLTLPFIGFSLYKLSMYLVKKKPLPLKNIQLLQATFCIPIALFFWDYSFSKVIHPDAYNAFITSLPWKMTFLEPQKAKFTLKEPLNPPLEEQKIFQVIQNEKTKLKKKPNIYLFIVESLREDVITAKITPHLEKMKHLSIHSSQAISSGNGSHLSWFSIFHSQFPFFWKILQKKKWSMGSPPLALLKKWGYQIHLYTSAQLGYYGMKELLFGQDQSLLTSYKEFPHFSSNAAEADFLNLNTLKKDLLQNPDLQSGQVFISFWDCTHFNYNWPKNWTPQFTPFAQELAYFRIFHSKQTIEAIKNRYKNAVNYMDSLFGDFYANLPNREDAVIVFTGDHGEEFFEQGHLFHNSHLTHEQIHIPLFIKFGNQEPFQKNLASQIDIFPSIIDYLSNQTFPFLKGRSLFRENASSYAITARFNAGKTPYEFSIHNDAHKLIAQFPNRHNIFETEKLKIISLKDTKDHYIDIEDVKGWIETEFSAALNNLFMRDDTLKIP